MSSCRFCLGVREPSPDKVAVEVHPAGLARGRNWSEKRRTRQSLTPALGSSVLGFLFLLGFLGTPAPVSLFTPFPLVGISLVLGLVARAIVAVPFPRAAAAPVRRSVSLFALLFLPAALFLFVVSEPHLSIDVLSGQRKKRCKQTQHDVGTIIKKSSPNKKAPQ